MTKYELTRLRNLTAKSQFLKLDESEARHLKRLEIKKKKYDSDGQIFNHLPSARVPNPEGRLT